MQPRLGVAFNNSQKPRLILDSHYVNKHLRSCKFQYEDIRTAANLFKRGDWFIKFDYVSGYHHVEIFPEHTNFLGCSWIVNGTIKFFKFTVLPFGLSTGPYVFSKIQRALVKHWRGKGLGIFTFLDDAAGAESSLDLARDMSTIVQQDIAQSGFVAHTEKCQWEPTQSRELLGFIMDLGSGNFYVPPRRVEALRTLVHRVRTQKFYASARCLARLNGMLVSMVLALGPVVRLWTRALYREIMQAASWDRLFLLSEEAQSEVKFWMENFSNSGYPIWLPCPRIDVMTYSDASEIGWGGYAVQIGDLSATGCWSEADRKRSSTWREIRGTKLVLQSLVDSLKGKCFTGQIIKILCAPCLWVAENRTCIKMRLTFISFVKKITFVYLWSGLVEMLMYKQTPYHDQRMQMTINWSQLHLINWTKCGQKSNRCFYSQLGQ